MNITQFQTGRKCKTFTKSTSSEWSPGPVRAQPKAQYQDKLWASPAPQQYYHFLLGVPFGSNAKTLTKKEQKMLSSFSVWSKKIFEANTETVKQNRHHASVWSVNLEYIYTHVYIYKYI
jgi:hypothetical protein